MANADIAALAADLAKAVETTMNAAASQADRSKAYEACENFKESSPLCAKAGLYLVNGTEYSNVSRHFGLQLMEHMVKYRWTQISQEEKIFIKDSTMKLLAKGGISDEAYMKDALSRIIVEMVKREWPQQWPGLLNELSEACACGEIQTELVLFVFLRLVEDVALLQTLECNQRRKDIYHALTANMASIFDFFLKVIELHISQLRSLSDTNNAKAVAHGRVVRAALLTLTGFVEWVSMTHIMAQNGRLLQILCLLLIDSNFQHYSAECLSQIVGRKGKLEERKSLMMIFNMETMQCLLTVALNPGSILDEEFYQFKKKLLQVFSGLTNQICNFWSKDPTFRPQNFGMFLEAVLAYSRHPSLCLAHLANPLWNTMLKHEHIARDSIFLSYVPQLIQFTAPKLIKFNYNCLPNNDAISDTLAFAKLDFDSEEEFSNYFYRSRSDFLDNFRQATLVAPLVTFNYVEQWLLKCLSVPCSATGLTQTDPMFQEWEALANFIESIFSRVLQAHERPSVAAGLRLLQLCLNYHPIDPLIMSTLLTCISALFVFLSMSTGQMAPTVNSIASSGAALLPQVLEKIFATFIVSSNNRNRAHKNLRRHAACLMIKIGHKYPLLLLPVFDQIRATVENLCRTNAQAGLSTLEKITLYESLLLISNNFGDYERQSTFIGEILQEANAQFLIIVNSGALKSAQDFIAFIGLDKPPDPINTENASSQHRGSLFYCINLILGVIKRCSWPDDPERATRGGFVVSLTESGNPVCRNPAASHIVPLLPHILSLMKLFNEFFASEGRSLIDPAFICCLDMPDTEKSNLLGLIGEANRHSYDSGYSVVQQTPVERMHGFLTGLHESCYHMLGAMGPSLGRDLYNIPDISIAIINSVLASLEHLPDYRFRPIVRVFLKPFMFSCPAPYYDKVLLPIMVHIAPIILNKLHINWQKVNEFRNREIQEDNTDNQEVLDDFLTRAMTREYLELMKVALVGGSLTPENHLQIMETEDVSHSPSPPPARSNIASEVISDLGLLLLRNKKTCESIVWVVLGALSWIDSIASLKATYLIGPIVKQLSVDSSLNVDMATSIMVSVLHALMIHGQHDANQGCLLTLGVAIYEILRPNYVEVSGVLQQIPNVNLLDIQKLDERIFGSTSKGSNKVEKVKKDLFKKITANLMGKSVGQLFKKETKISNLPQIPSNKKSDHQNIIPNLSSLYNTY